ncbi:unnamed protein product [Cuscuta campestris]|uniref:Uncharacterized protein n=1 Tax=Cuscuta campestris TaxID=132261 RepID=A0A484MV41_9ASTE|nr:unnamed protein product [Cuscuta campestris]
MKKVGDKLIPKTEDEFDAEDIKKVENYAKAINMLYCAVNPDDYRKISCCSTAKEMWDKLEVTYEGMDQVCEAKIDFLIQEYVMFRMKEHEKIDDMFDRFSKIVNDLHALKKTYTDRDLVRKIIRSLMRMALWAMDVVKPSTSRTNARKADVTPAFRGPSSPATQRSGRVTWAVREPSKEKNGFEGFFQRCHLRCFPSCQRQIWPGLVALIPVLRSVETTRNEKESLEACNRKEREKRYRGDILGKYS